jgi:hypothetical protein
LRSQIEEKKSKTEETPGPGPKEPKTERKPKPGIYTQQDEHEEEE